MERSRSVRSRPCAAASLDADGAGAPPMQPDDARADAVAADSEAGACARVEPGIERIRTAIREISVKRIEAPRSRIFRACGHNHIDAAPSHGLELDRLLTRILLRPGRKIAPATEPKHSDEGANGCQPGALIGNRRRERGAVKRRKCGVKKKRPVRGCGGLGRAVGWPDGA